MKWLSDIRVKLKGWKTYLVCTAAIIGVVVLWADGDVSHLEAVEGIVKAIFGITLRAGIARVLD